MLYLMVLLRFLHILSGIFWVGSALMLTYFISPSVQATQESGQKFFSHLLQKTPLMKIITSTALITVGAGLALYWVDSDGFKSGWMYSGPGLGFGLGGLAGLIGLYYGIQQGRRSTAMVELGKQVQSQGHPPTEDQLKSIQNLQAQLKTGGLLNAIFLLLASLLMATARFWVF
jgi:hypothetical protein